MSATERKPRSVRVLSVALAATLAVAIAGLVYIVVAPIPLTPGLTELSLVGPDGSASGYPTNLTANESATVTVVVENREHEETTYTLLVQAADTTLQTHTMTLAAGDTWRRDISFRVPSDPPPRITFALYRTSAPDPSADPYRLTYLTLNATSTADR